LWYPWAAWVPYYTVADQYANNYDGSSPLPESAYQRNTTDFGNDPLPDLPTFESVGIDISPLKSFKGAQLNPKQKAVAQGIRDAIDRELETLKTEYSQEESEHYHPAPDFDRARFMWVKEV
jgi:hypothetical protein